MTEDKENLHDVLLTITSVGKRIHRSPKWRRKRNFSSLTLLSRLKRLVQIKEANYMSMFRRE